MFNRLAFISSCLISLVAATLPAASSVITEDDEQFSRHWKSPTEIGSGFETVMGTAEKQNAHEFIAFTSLQEGAQVLSFVFTVPDDARESDKYSGGGAVLWSSDPFKHAWDGQHAGQFQLDRWSPTGMVDLVLGDDFQGELYLGIYFTHGRDVAWQLSAPGNAMPAVSDPDSPNNIVVVDESETFLPVPVPLPAGLLLLLGGMSAFGGLRLRQTLASSGKQA